MRSGQNVIIKIKSTHRFCGLPGLSEREQKQNGGGELGYETSGNGILSVGYFVAPLVCVLLLSFFFFCCPIQLSGCGLLLWASFASCAEYVSSLIFFCSRSLFAQTSSQFYVGPYEHRAFGQLLGPLENLTPSRQFQLLLHSISVRCASLRSRERPANLIRRLLNPDRTGVSLPPISGTN